MPESNKKVYKANPKGPKVMTDEETARWYASLTPEQRAHYFKKR